MFTGLLIRGTILTPDEFLAEAKKLHNFIGSHSRLCADYINQYWLERDGRFANARVHMFGEGESDGRHIIVSNMMKTQSRPANQLVVRERQQVISDAYLRFALRMACQQRRIEELKRLCGVK